MRHQHAPNTRARKPRPATRPRTARGSTRCCVARTRGARRRSCGSRSSRALRGRRDPSKRVASRACACRRRTRARSAMPRGASHADSSERGRRLRAESLGVARMARERQRGGENWPDVHRRRGRCTTTTRRRRRRAPRPRRCLRVTDASPHTRRGLVLASALLPGVPRFLFGVTPELRREDRVRACAERLAVFHRRDATARTSRRYSTRSARRGSESGGRDYTRASSRASQVVARLFGHGRAGARVFNGCARGTAGRDAGARRPRRCVFAVAWQMTCLHVHEPRGPVRGTRVAPPPGFRRRVARVEAEATEVLTGPSPSALLCRQKTRARTRAAARADAFRLRAAARAWWTSSSPRIPRCLCARRRGGGVGTERPALFGDGRFRGAARRVIQTARRA